MEAEFNALKDFMLETLPSYITEASSSDTPMYQLTDKTIIFGAVDITKFNTHVVVSVLPEEQDESESPYISGRAYDSKFTVTFICMNSKYEVLVRQMARYASAFRAALLKAQGLNESMKISDVGQRKYYVDVGSADKQATAFEAELTITTNELFNK